MKTIFIFLLIINLPILAIEKATLSPTGDGWVGGVPIVCPDGVIRGGKVCTLSPWGDGWVGGTRAVACPDGETIKGGTKCIIAPDGSWVGVE